jgi:hypothetical protein
MQVPALRILSGLLGRWAPNRLAFEELQGYCILLYILSQSELSFEVFEVLLDVSITKQCARADVLDARTRSLLIPSLYVYDYKHAYTYT